MGGRVNKMKEQIGASKIIDIFSYALMTSVNGVTCVIVVNLFQVVKHTYQLACMYMS